MALSLPITKAQRKQPPPNANEQEPSEIDCLEKAWRNRASTVYHKKWVKLNVFTVTSKENDHCVGYFGEINPLSNFFPAPFQLDGIRYVSSEQFIQSTKAKYFGDLDTYNQLLCVSTSHECKELSRQIRNVNEEKWFECAGELCFPGIRAKFHQNPYCILYEYLDNKDINKKNHGMYL